MNTDKQFFISWTSPLHICNGRLVLRRRCGRDELDGRDILTVSLFSKINLQTSKVLCLHTWFGRVQMNSGFSSLQYYFVPVSQVNKSFNIIIFNWYHLLKYSSSNAISL